jgi:hypothetical protein
MFTLSGLPADGADTRFLLPPAVPKLQEAAPIEKVHYLRDEMANMAWAFEQTVPSAMGAGISGYLVAARSAGATPQPPMQPTPPPVRYMLGTDVPYNWFPFMHVPGSNCSVRLQRARMSGPPRAIRTRLLGPPAPYYINEEEIPRAGKLATRGFQRVCWLDGATVTWIGRRVTTGRGEGSSGLAFDQLADVPPNQ